MYVFSALALATACTQYASESEDGLQLSAREIKEEAESAGKSGPAAPPMGIDVSALRKRRALLLADNAGGSAPVSANEGKRPRLGETAGERAATADRPASRVASSSSGLTRLVAFDAAPFPYHGAQPGGAPFLDVTVDGEQGHRERNGAVLWERESFNDSRVLVHIPKKFDPARPGVMVVFFHGFGATLERDVLRRQKVPMQVSSAGANAVLVAPQFAVDARDGSAGRFWEPDGFSRFLDEAARRLADLSGDPSNERVFRRLPVALVAYSGGFAPAAYALRDKKAAERVKSVVLLDAAYGELDVFAQWASHERAGVFVSACTRSTQRQNAELKRLFATSGVDYGVGGEHIGRGATFIDTGSDYPHRDYVTQAWVAMPIREVLEKMSGAGADDWRFADSGG